MPARSASARRGDYVPTVRPRPRDNPKRTWVSMATNTVRQSLLIPSAGKRVRLIRIKVRQDTAEAEQLLELFFGTGATASADRSKIIEIVKVPNGGEVATRTYDALGHGPVGLINESISCRWRTAVINSHIAMVEYLEE